MPAHSALTGTELHEAFQYIQSADPGAVGANKYWVDTTSAPFVLKRRNAANTAWDTIGTSGGATITVSDESTPLATGATTLNFTGTGVTASGTGATKTITIPGGAAADPISELVWVEEFISGNTASAAIGTHGWTIAGGTASNTASEANHPGIMSRATGASASVIAYSTARGNVSTGLVDPDDMFDLTFIMKFGATNVLGNCVFRCGLSDGWSATAGMTSHFAGIQKLAADTTFFGKMQTALTAAVSAALAVDTWYKIRIRRIDATTIGFTVDGGTELTLNGTNPGDQLHLGFALTNTAAATNENIAMDLVSLKVTGLTR